MSQTSTIPLPRQCQSDRRKIVRCADPRKRVARPCGVVLLGQVKHTPRDRQIVVGPSYLLHNEGEYRGGNNGAGWFIWHGEYAPNNTLRVITPWLTIDLAWRRLSRCTGVFTPPTRDFLLEQWWGADGMTGIDPLLASGTTIPNPDGTETRIYPCLADRNDAIGAVEWSYEGGDTVGRFHKTLGFYRLPVHIVPGNEPDPPYRCLTPGNTYQNYWTGCCNTGHLVEPGIRTEEQWDMSLRGWYYNNDPDISAPCNCGSYLGSTPQPFCGPRKVVSMRDGNLTIVVRIPWRVEPLTAVAIQQALNDDYYHPTQPCRVRAVVSANGAAGGSGVTFVGLCGRVRHRGYETVNLNYAINATMRRVAPDAWEVLEHQQYEVRISAYDGRPDYDAVCNPNMITQRCQGEVVPPDTQCERDANQNTCKGGDPDGISPCCGYFQRTRFRLFQESC